MRFNGEPSSEQESAAIRIAKQVMSILDYSNVAGGRTDPKDARRGTVAFDALFGWVLLRGEISK